MKSQLEHNQHVASYMHEIERHFSEELKRPELLNRLGDNIVVFNSIRDRAFLKEIAKSKLRSIETYLREKYKVSLRFLNEETLFDALVARVNIGHGGRGVLNELESSIVNPLSNYIFEQEELLLPNTAIEVIGVGQGAAIQIHFQVGMQVSL